MSTKVYANLSQQSWSLISFTIIHPHIFIPPFQQIWSSTSQISNARYATRSILTAQKTVPETTVFVASKSDTEATDAPLSSAMCAVKWDIWLKPVRGSVRSVLRQATSLRIVVRRTRVLLLFRILWRDQWELYRQGWRCLRKTKHHHHNKRYFTTPKHLPTSFFFLIGDL